MRSAVDLITQAKVDDKVNKPCSLLSEVMMTLRRVERTGFEEPRRSSQRSARLRDAFLEMIKQWRPHAHLAAVQDLAAELANGDAKASLTELHEQKNNFSEEQMARH